MGRQASREGRIIEAGWRRTLAALGSRRLRAVLWAWVALGVTATGAAATELNTASRAELEQLKGVGPQLSDAILHGREQAAFADWHDFLARVRGIAPRKAGQLSQAGLTVNGAPYAATPAQDKTVKPTPPAASAGSQPP